MSYNLKSKNQLVVELFMAMTGDKRQAVPLHPLPPPDEVRLLRARLMLEECLETIQKGLGVQVFLRDPGDIMVGEPERQLGLDFKQLGFLIESPVDIVELADGLADCEVVNLGTASAAGIAHQPVFEEVMRNNLAKFGPGHTLDAGGKLVKPPDHEPPDLARILQLQVMSPGEAVFAKEARVARYAKELC